MQGQVFIPARFINARRLKIISGVLIGLLLMGCETYSNGGVQSREQGATGFVLADGSYLKEQMRRADREAMTVAFENALSDQQQERISWTTNRMSGAVSAGTFLVGNILPDPDATLPAPDGIDVTARVETEQGTHVLTKNSNIRLGPSTKFGIVETLPSGTPVEGLGKVVGAPWMLVGVDGQVSGYVFMDLLVKAPGTGLLNLAGGPERQMILCRAYSMSMRLSATNEADSPSDRWSGIACDHGSGFVPQRRRAPTDLLLDGR